MSLRSTIVRQFERPTGLVGALAGAVMASRSGNIKRNMWTLDLLNPQPGESILELGCGPGVALAESAARVAPGFVMGLDHSAVMVRQASSRCADAISEGHVTVKEGGLERLAATERRFDKAYSANVLQFIDDKAAAFRLIRRVLKPGGQVATTYQPRSRNPTRQQALAMASKLRDAMQEAGFQAITLHELPLADAPAICLMGRRA